ncbi:MAG: DUF1416 domain-containing protein [Geodermatophilaceae bacterium]|nr:DUF1416 domain-containing protein [Geodermatophilaceae bacterium]
MCGAPAQKASGAGLEGVDMKAQTVIQGVVESDGAPVPAAYVRLLDSTGEFTAEVVTSATGDYRFFAAPGRWTVRALSPAGRGETAVVAERGLTEAGISLG